MGAKMYYFQMTTLFVCLILLLISYSNNDGNIKFEMTFTITQPNTITFALKHRQLEYGVNDDLWETKYSDMDLAQVVDRIFVDSGSLSEAVLNQLIDLTQDYADSLVEDIGTSLGMSQSQKDDLSAEVERYTPDYEANMDDIMGDISFGDSLNVDQNTNDAFRWFEIPSQLVAAGMALCVLMMITISLFYFEKLTESCCCKCCTSLICLLPALFSILIIGVTWIVLAQVYESQVNVDWASAENGLKDGLNQVLNDYFINYLVDFSNDNNIPYNNYGTVLEATLDQIGDFSDEVTVGTSPWLQSLAGLLFFLFACGFCCCQTKKEDEGKAWDEGHRATGGGDVEFGSNY